MVEKPPAKLRILLIDDDREDYLLTRELLITCTRKLAASKGLPGYDLDWVSTYEAGLAALQAGQYDVYLVDYRLGPVEGTTLIQEAVELGLKAPIIMMTGQGSYQLDLEAMRIGATDYLVKSELTPQLLERTIRYALDRKRTEEELEQRVRERTQELEHANLVLRAEIAERRRMEMAVEQERQRLFSLLDELPAFVYLQAPDYSIRFSNCTFQERFGRPDGQTCYHLFRNSDQPCEYCPTRLTFDERQPAEWETQHPDGRDYQVYNYPFTDVDGSPLALTLVTDISRRKQIEAQLELNNRELLDLSEMERIQRHLAEGLVQASKALNSSLNLEEVLDRILEQTQSVIPCRATAVILLEGDMGWFVRHRGFDELPETQSIIQTRFTLNEIPVFSSMALSSQPVLIPDTEAYPEWKSFPGLSSIRSYAAVPLQIEGKTIGFLNILSEQPYFFNQESTNRLQVFAVHATIAIQNARLYEDLEKALDHEQAMRAQLIQSEKFAAMGRMAASVAHELNNPLQIIKNCLFLIKSEIPDNPDYHEYLQIAVTETQRLSNLVTDLRELYRPRTPLPLVPVDIYALLEEVHAILDYQFQDPAIRWQFSNPRRSVQVAGVKDQLKQVFINICSNAIEAMQPKGGTITIRIQSTKASNQIGVMVKDTGPGIQPDDLSKLFEPFFTTKVNGLGLGLPISYEIIEQHGGHIEVKSQLNRGSTFTVWLPLAKLVG